MKIISFEGCIAAGKTSLTNHFSGKLKLNKVLEDYEKNPFLEESYKGMDVNLETEITFLLILYSQLRRATKLYDRDEFVLCDFSIESNLIHARLSLNKEELELFKIIYDYVVREIGVPYAVIYIDISPDIMKKRIIQRGRPYEINTDFTYFEEYRDKVNAYYRSCSLGKVYFFNGNKLSFDPNNKELKQIRNKILEIMNE